MSVFFVVAITALSFAQGAVSLPRTGETFCYDVSGDLVPPKQGGAVPYSQYLLANATIITNGDGTITDSLTGLTWLTDADCIATSYPSFNSDGDYTGDSDMADMHMISYGMNGGHNSALRQGAFGLESAECKRIGESDQCRGAPILPLVDEPGLYQCPVQPLLVVHKLRGGSGRAGPGWCVSEVNP